MNLTQLFCDVDDFCQYFMPEWRKQLVSSEETKRNRTHRMSYSEIITIWIFYHPAIICEILPFNKSEGYTHKKILFS